MNTSATIRLKPGKERSLERKHPWVFSGAIAGNLRDHEEGSIVKVVDINGRYLGTGYVQYGSIAVRIISFNDRDIDAAFWEERIRNSYNLRKNCGLADGTHTDCYRLMHGEGDGIPGLIIDVYKDTAVIQCHTGGIHLHRQMITEAILKVMGDTIVSVYDKSKEALHDHQAADNSYLFGTQSAGIVSENGNLFKVDWIGGQKTGFFLDQRDNRRLLGEYSRNKTVLNTFAYTGGFSVYAAKNGALKVDSVDVSKQAIGLLNDNMALNGIPSEKYNSYAEDTFRFFKGSEELYDLVVLDPPAFAKNISARHNAIMGYKRLNAEGLKKVKPGGLLFTFSCSQVVDSSTFLQTVYSAAIESGRELRILHRLTQGADHPVNLFHPEGEYLKGLVLEVE